MNNYQINSSNHSSLSDVHYVRMDDRLTPKRLIGGLLFAAAFIATFIVLASVV